MIINAGTTNLSITPQHRENQPSANMTADDAKRLVGLLDEGLDAYTNIKNVPTASNSVSKTDTFTNTSSSGSLDVSKIQPVKLERNYERDYTANDALNNCWFASAEKNCFALYKSCSRVSDPAVSDMSKGEFLDYLRSNGLDKEISWEGVEKNLSGSVDYENLGEFSDYAAALFAGLESRIKADFSGDEQMEQLEKLNSVIENTVKNFSEQFSERYGKAFDSLDADLPKDKLEASINKIIRDKTSAYTDFISKNKDYAGVENTEDSWLKRDLGFMTCALRKAFTPAKAQSDGELWSENDLIAIGMTSELLGEDDLFRQACAVLQNKDEEYVGMGIAMKWLATKKITVELGVSDSVKGLLGGLVEKYAKKQMDAVDNALAKSRNDPLGTTEKAFPDLDRAAVFSIVDVMKKSYAESGDEKKAIIDTAAFARKTYLEKANSSKYAEVWRYNCSSSNARSRYSREFWENFYSTDSKSSHGGGMSKILSAWEKFSEALEKKDLDYYKKNTSANTFRGYASRTLNGAVYGGYSGGKYWGTNLEDIVKS